MRTFVFDAIISLLVLVVVLLVAPVPSTGSLLPFRDRLDGPLSDRFPDPFLILEHIPFGLERDNVAVMPARVDWKETPDAHHIMIDVPGLKKDELKIELLEERVLRISGEREEEEEKKKGDHWHCVERAHGRFWRQFRLPDNVDVDSVSAKLENGVLTVTLKKLPPHLIKGPKVVGIAAAGGEEGYETKKEGATGVKDVEL